MKTPLSFLSRIARVPFAACSIINLLFIFFLPNTVPAQNSSLSASKNTELAATYFIDSIAYGGKNEKGVDAASSTTVLVPSFLSLSPIDSLKIKMTKAKKNRIQWVGAASIATYGGSLLLLNEAWYKNEASTKFHVYDDSGEWQQVDKIGHGWSAYNLARGSSSLWQWAGLSHKQAAWIGGLSGTVYLTVIEFLDAHSAKWGWSWSDMAANISGSLIYTAQELIWKKQRIQYKFSFHPKKYDDPELKKRADDLYGKSWPERMLKDYNGQTYWLSANIKSFFPETGWPDWLNISVGYGAEGMFGGYKNQWTSNETPPTLIDRTDIRRRRVFYLSPDIDFTKIKTKSKFLKTLLFALNSFKCPAPALLFSNGKLKLKPFYF